MSEIDPVTLQVIQWAKRSARAHRRDMMTLEDFLCGLYAARDEDRVLRQIKAVVGVTVEDLKWPDEVRALYEKASQEPATDEKIPMSPTLKAAVNRAHDARPDLAPETLIPNLLKDVLPPIARLIAVNRKQSTASPLIARMEGLLEKTERLAALLNERVLGQATAVQMLCDAYFHASLGAAPNGPRGVFTFLGPPGVGKTLLAECFATALSEVETTPYAWRRFDMSTFSGPQSHEQLFGSPKMYQGSSPGTLTGLVAEQPKAVVLFDEIEKAHDLTIQSLLAVLDKGEVADKALDKVVSFRDTWVILTTNLGREFFDQSNESGFLQGVAMSTAAVFDLLASARRFREIGADEGQGARPALAPEFVSRLAKGGAVVFNRLETRHYLQLVSHSIERQLKGAAGTGGTPLPSFHLDDEARFLFVASLLPNLDARQTVARSERWAVDSIKRSFEECREPILQANPADYAVRIGCGDDARSFLAAARADAEVRVLVIDDDPDVLPPALAAAVPDCPPKVRRVSAQDDVAREVQRFQPTCALLDLSIDEDEGSPRIEVGMRLLETLRSRFPDLPVYLYSEDPQDRSAFDLAVRRVLKHGGARGFLPVRHKDPTALHAEDLQGRLRDLLEEHRSATILQHLRRAHKTVTFQVRFQWDAAGAMLRGEMTGTRESVVISAEDQTATIKFSGIPRETFAQVVGLSRAKRRLAQVVEWLRNPGKLGAFGMSPPRGFLLAGPPGTGKTLLARALAGEAGLPFLSLSAAEVQSKWVGESEERIRELFQRARDYAPAIVFIDEIDGIARKRSSNEMQHTYSTLNQLLSCMDGFGGGSSQVFVLAATNHPDDLDPAILRPGRFDEVIPIDLPNAEARREFFRLKLAGLVDGDIDLAGLVEGTVGCSPAALDRIVREATYAASAADRSKVTIEDLEKARRLVKFGAAREGFQVRGDERRLTAWHEAGHALAHLVLFPDRRIDHLTIVPNEAGALGFLAPLGDETRHDLCRRDVESRIAVSLAGREAERLLLGTDPADLSAGASSDLAHATALAWQAVTGWGFDEEFGQVSLEALPADATAPFIESARGRIQAWIAAGAVRAREVLARERPRLERLANRLQEQESLDWDGIRDVTN